MGTNYTLREVFKAGFEAFRRTGGMLPFQLKAGLAILRCRTAELGGHAKRCPAGCVEKVWYNSCRHRACPLCAWIKIHQWLETIRARLLPTDHYHTTFTLPGELRVFWNWDRRAINDLMFKTARMTLFNALADPKHLGAKPGILMSLHTWSRDLWAHIHIHCLVTGGGVTPDGQWKPSTNGFLVPQEVLRYWFRKRFTKALRRMIKSGKIELPPDMCRFDALCLLTEAERKECIVDVEERYEHGLGVAAYLANYVRGGPLKNSRLVSLDKQNKTVTFRVSRKGEPWQQRTLTIKEFIRRVLWHVPETGYRVVRACGLYHHHYREQLEACREQLGGGGLPTNGEPEADTPTAGGNEEPPDEEWILVEDYCRICGCLLEVKAIPRAPPAPEPAPYPEPSPWC